MEPPYNPRISTCGAGPSIVLISGMDGTGQLFYTQVPGLARSYRVTTYWLRESATDMSELVSDLGAVVETVAGPAAPVILLGESFGGALSLSFALAHPERVAALVIINSFPAFLPQFRLRLARAALRALPWGVMTVVRRLTAFRMHSRHTTRDELRRFQQLMRATTREGYLNRLTALLGYDVRPHLGELRMPVLFIASDSDHLVPAVEQATYMAARVPRATVQILEGHGHICLLAPDLDISAILAAWPPLAGTPA